MALTIEEIYQLVKKDKNNLDVMTTVLLKFIDFDILRNTYEVVLRDNLTLVKSGWPIINTELPLMIGTIVKIVMYYRDGSDV